MGRGSGILTPFWGGHTGEAMASGEQLLQLLWEQTNIGHHRSEVGKGSTGRRRATMSLHLLCCSLSRDHLNDALEVQSLFRQGACVSVGLG